MEIRFAIHVFRPRVAELLGLTKIHITAWKRPSMKVRGYIEFTITEQSPETVVSEMPVQPGIKNPFGVVHAGALLWFADVTASVLVLGSGDATEGMKGFPLAIALNANFLGNQQEGSFKAVASYVKRGRTVSVVRTVVYGASEKLIADVTTSHVLTK